MKRSGDVVIVGKNRQQAFWSLAIIAFMVPLSGWFLVLGLTPGKAGIGWSMVLFGSVGLAAFGVYAAQIVGMLRSPWHLALSPSHLSLCTPTYDLQVPWERVEGIAVAEVNRRLGCVLVFDDAAAVAGGAAFRRGPASPEAVTNAARMQARMEENLASLGYHLGIPGRMLELGPEALAELLARGRTGELWQEA